MQPRRARTHHRVLSGAAALANCLTAGAPFVFALFSPQLQSALQVTASKVNLIASSAILGEYALAAYFGSLADRRGPGAVSFVSAALFAAGFSGLVWRYKLALSRELEGAPPHDAEWVVVASCWFFVGCGTAASYFAGIISLAKSTPARHSGLAIGVPCAVFGLSPLFLSSVASFFTTASSVDGRRDMLDVAKYLTCIGVLLTFVNLVGGFLIQELPWGENLDKPFVNVVEPFGNGDDECGVDQYAPDSGFNSSATRPVGADQVSTERTALLGASTTPSSSVTTPSGSLRALISSSSFWLLGAVVLLATGPCEMYMASLGSVVSSLSRLPALHAAAPISALALRKRHIAVISVVNTLWRLVVGGASDYLAAAGPDKDRQPAWRRQVRLVFVAVACVGLAAAYGWGATGLATPAGLWVITFVTAVAYGTIFTLTPALVRTRWSPDDFGRNWGLLTWFSAVGALVFTPLFGVLRDLATDGTGESSSCTSTRCYRPIFALSAVSATLATALVGLLATRWARRTGASA
ncbi:hypothetical protein JCM3775_001504 [Rhodotorula graminis]